MCLYGEGRLAFSTVVPESLNPYCSGCVSMANLIKGDIVIFHGVLILIVVDVSLWPFSAVVPEIGSGSLNPYCSGCVSMAANSVFC